MTIREITEYITITSQRSKSPFGLIQEVRKKHLGINPNPKTPFSGDSPKDEEGYAFHSGGRNEFQFNLGKDQINGKDVFRYGLAFSLEPNINLTNPLEQFNSSRLRFNSYLENNSNKFFAQRMWQWKGTDQTYFDKVTSITDQLFQLGSFIFIGKYFDKPISDITPTDLNSVVDYFDSQMQFYTYVQFGEDISIEKKWARITYNDQGWVRPSGSYGKSSTSGIHESTHGYGHEEWLFDDKIIDGYKYGFLQSINNKENTYRGKRYDISLFTIDGISKKRYVVGNISNVYALTLSEAEQTKRLYEANGWLDIMHDQIEEIGGDSTDYKSSTGLSLFNIRYKLKDLETYDEWIEVDPNHQIYRLSRYNLVNVEEENNDRSVGFLFNSSNLNDSSDYNEDSNLSERPPRIVESRNIHNKISNGLKAYLSQRYPGAVSREHKSGVGNTRIDMVAMIDGEIIFYEIKSYNNIKSCIRDAIGQLMEYSYWPNQQNAAKLIIVSQKLKGINDAKAYMANVRSLTGLHIYYQYFDLESNTLSKEY